MQTWQILGVVLAGGGSRRFGSDKRAARLGGKPLIQWAIERARPQVQELLVNANSDLPVWSATDRIADAMPGEGPLAGIVAGLTCAKSRGFSHVASFACDTPFFPQRTVERLAQALYSSSAGYAVARCGETEHRIFAVWPVSQLAVLQTAFEEGARSMRSLENWLTPVWADFPPGGGPGGDPFYNINTPASLCTAKHWLTCDT